MNVAQLMFALQGRDPLAEVMILDGENGGGTPREINLGPIERVIRPEDGNDSADCENRVGHEVIVLGFGCY